ncbi:DUF58 domain-containing protein [Agriterribacter sp.]|uniref:DUF58 domain-containing protein n=1 Tax=Agriterribacter sp. TaxID=2821509 RepID=UPI002C7D228E|nr:DUF58 domain-containing protein [Agriterribacter sp.]HTN05221.1 DUF58 domain-containing protein [Agriterribacter sp.]
MKAKKRVSAKSTDNTLSVADILKKVKELEIRSKKLTANLFTGEYHTAFKGRGMVFKEVREYVAGDDVRFIDWNVSARMGAPFSKLFEEERELTMMLLVDISASSLFGTVQQRKKDLITEVCAVLAFSAVNNNDKVGVIFFSDKVEFYIPPKKGKEHVLYVVRELLTVQPKSKGTNLNEAVRFFNTAVKQKSIAFILSDFMVEQYDDPLRVAGNRHDVIGIKVYDKMDMDLPEIGMTQVQDAETGRTQWIDTNDKMVQYNYHEQFMRNEEACRLSFLKSGADLLYLRTDENYVKVLQQFFSKRKKTAK